MLRTVFLRVQGNIRRLASDRLARSDDRPAPERTLQDRRPGGQGEQMLDENDSTTSTTAPTTGDSGPAPESPDTPSASAGAPDEGSAPAVKKTARKTAKKASTRTTRKVGAAKTAAPDPSAPEPGAPDATAADASGPSAADAGSATEAAQGADAPVKKAAAKKTTAKRATKKSAAKKAAAKTSGDGTADGDTPDSRSSSSDSSSSDSSSSDSETQNDTAPSGDPSPSGATSLLFKAPDPVATPSRRKKAAAASPFDDEAAGSATAAGSDDSRGSDESGDSSSAGSADDSDDSEDEQGGNRRRRRRGGRRRRKGAGGDDSSEEESEDSPEDSGDSSKGSEDKDESGGSGGRSGGRGGGGRGSGQKNQKGSGQRGQNRSDQNKSDQNKSDQNKSGSDDNAKDDDQDDQGDGNGTRRRRRRRRAGEEGDGGPDDPQNTVTRVRTARSAEDEITSLHGSTRLEAKKQRRREGREAGRRRAPIVSEAEFLARREAVDRVMVIRQRKDLTQIAVLEDQVLVEHYVARESQTSLIGNVYLGRVQNVLPSMEAAFIDIGKGRNAVLYAGEVNWDSLGAGNGPRKIEQVLKSGQPILVQVSKDPIGHKGARLTSQVSLPGRFLVYVPDGTTSGISRKLPDTERSRLKTLLKEIVPDTAGVIVRTAAEGASEDELTLDVERLTARWSDIEDKIDKGNAPQLLYGEPDLTLRVVRDLFTEDFAKLVVSGGDAWDMVDGYVKHVAPDLEERLEKYSSDEDVFAAYRIDEQIAKGLDRKVWLPSGGSLVIDRTEAMTVVDVNTGKFTGSGGNLEETVTKNNLEAAEEMVRQLRLRDIGGIIVVDFIDMVLESNRDLVLRRLVECLGRDRTRHQVAEVTSLGLVQMTRKRIGTGLLEAFSENCEHCQGGGLMIHHEPVENKKKQDEEPRRGRRGRRGESGDSDDNGNGNRSSGNGNGAAKASPSPKDVAAMAKHEHKPVIDPGADANGAPVGGDVGKSDARPPEQTAARTPSLETAAGGESSVEPAAESSPEAAAERSPAPADPTVAGSSPGPSSESPPASGPDPSSPTQPEATSPPEPVPTGPQLVTSSRRRVARRPAGPPSGAQAAGEADAPTSVLMAEGTPATSDGDGGSQNPEPAAGDSPHVPVKKRGARKR